MTGVQTCALPIFFGFPVTIEHMSDDEILHFIVESFADGIENADIEPSVWLDGLANKNAEDAKTASEW